MPYADNQGVRIHYAVEGDGPPLLLYHGKTFSMAEWYELGYVDALKGDHRLILLDARGHGASDKPHDPAAYTLRAQAGDAVAVLDALGLPAAAFLGYSLGGWVGFALGVQAPARWTALAIGGAHPYRRDPAPNERVIALLRQGIAAYVAHQERSYALPPAFRARLLASDAAALAAVTRAASDEPSLEGALGAIATPCLLFAGERDPGHALAQRAAARLPDARFVSFPGLGHVEDLARPDLVLPHLRAFLAEVRERGAPARTGDTASHPGRGAGP